jgi:hypothetical protein
MLVATSNNKQCDYTIGQESADKHTVEEHTPKGTARLILGAEDVPKAEISSSIRKEGW